MSTVLLLIVHKVTQVRATYTLHKKPKHSIEILPRSPHPCFPITALASTAFGKVICSKRIIIFQSITYH